jgi:1-acyl-sn-glycerol-3-phosphate acyltransferase
MRKYIAHLILIKIWGWKLVKHYPANVPKSVIVVFHHTSNWDFPLGVLLRPVMRTDIKFMGKSSLFIFPFGYLFKALGGFPVKRDKNHNYVETIANLYKTEKELRLCITPEGTRSKVTKLKTGFYHIAIAAGVPFVMCKFDWGNKILAFDEPFYPTGDYDEDMKYVANYFKGVKGKYPENDYIF